MTAPTSTPLFGRLRATGCQTLCVLAVLTAVVAVDQLTKWWAWRHAAGVVINRGGTWFLGGAVSRWYSGELSGAVLDLASCQVLAFGLFTLLRRRRPLSVLLPAACMISGWASNLGDRLGLHLLTAPGMPRGAVDFIHWGRYTYNVADVCITAGTLLFGAALYRQHRRNADAAVAGPVAGPRPGPQPWRRARRWALLAAVIPALLGTAATLTAAHSYPYSAGAPASAR